MNTQILADAISAAKAAARRAYCPYSDFPVGAAVATEGGLVFSGANIENASYGLTICAERAAVFQAVLEGELVIQLLVVYTPTPQPAAPCGACRQVIREFGRNARIYCCCDGEESLDFLMADLLPESFGPESLSR